MTVLETDGQSRMNEAVHGIHFEHVQGGRPLLKLTIAHDIAPAPAAESAQNALVGELVQEQQSPLPGGRRSAIVGEVSNDVSTHGSDALHVLCIQC